MKCLTPFFVENKFKKDMFYSPVPCGKCPPCRKNLIDGWVFRLLQEENRHACAYFITLTYSENNLIYNNYGRPIISKPEFQLFIKRLRKKTENDIRYYGVGEYGASLSRPHYHAIVFGGNQDAIRDCWKYGFSHFGSSSSHSVAYLFKYLTKRAGRNPQDYINANITPEFRLMSKGLGSNYLTPDIIEYHRKKLINYVLLPKYGKPQKVPMPRYYREKIFDEKSLFLLRYNAKKENEEMERLLLEKHGSYEAINKAHYMHVCNVLNNEKKFLTQKYNML